MCNKNARDWECPYCHVVLKSRRNLFNHYKVCSEKLNLPHDSRGRVISQKVIDGHSKRVNTIKDSILSGEYIPKGHPHTDESKRKLSIARKENIKNNIGSRWINPHIKRSYAEQYFYDFFTKEQLHFESNKWIGKYCVDFLFNKYYIEVDGEQHYTSESIEYDKVRDSYLHELGYTNLCRIRWSLFKKLSKDETSMYLSKLLTCIKVAIEDQVI